MITDLHVCQDCDLPFKALEQCGSDRSMPQQRQIICITEAYTSINGDSGPGYGRDFMSIVNPMLLFFFTKRDLDRPIPIGKGDRTIRMRHHTYVCCLGDLQSGTQNSFHVMDVV